MDRIGDASRRNYVPRALSRGEAYHQLRRAISNVNGIFLVRLALLPFYTKFLETPIRF
jgi:hypothetical protein